MPSLTITLILVGILIGFFAYQTTHYKSAISQSSFISLLEQVLSNDLKSLDSVLATEILKVAAYGNNVQFMELSDESGNMLARIGQPADEQGEVISRVIKSGEKDGGKNIAQTLPESF